MGQVKSSVQKLSRAVTDPTANDSYVQTTILVDLRNVCALIRQARLASCKILIVF